MRILTLVLIFACVEAYADQCAPGDKRACSIMMEKTLEFGRSYRLEIAEAQLEVETSAADDATGYWGAGGAYPASYINKLALSVEKSSFSIPLKAYSDLGNVTRAEVKENQFGIVLIVSGGDAETAYYATFVFIDGKLRKRTVRARALPDQLWEKTTFHAPTS